MKILKLTIALFVFTLSHNVNAQDIHFSQANQVPMLINPAAAGIFDGWERVAVNQKSQWVSSGTKFYTTAIAADMNILKPRRGNGAHMGLGLQFFNDIGGDSKFGTRQVSLSVSGIVPINKKSQLSGGLQFGIGQKFGDFNNLYFANQFDGEVFNSISPNGESNNLTTFMYNDISAGVFYRYGNSKLGFSKDNLLDFRVGLAYFHANTPTLSYRLGSTEEMFGKIVIHASIIKDFKNTKVGVEGYINLYSQGPHNETLVGALVRYKLRSGGKITGLSRDVYLSGGLIYRHKNAIAPTVNIQFKNFNFGISYDITIADFGSYYRGGGLEFSLKFTNRDFALFKRR